MKNRKERQDSNPCRAVARHNQRGRTYRPLVEEVASSEGLRKWYSHDVEKWSEFKKRLSKRVEG
jgi:uncharacterized protein YeaO (DUF488 family)